MSERAHDSSGAVFGAFGDRYDDVDTQLLDFRRRGRGVSYHELEVALGPEWRRVHSCMQISRRDRQILRRVGWSLSRAGRYERLLRKAAPDVPRAFLQPFLYLTLRKGP